MKDISSKRNKSVLIALAFLAVFTGILFIAELYLFRMDIRKDGQYKAESIRRTIVDFEEEAGKITDWFYEKLNENVRMSVFIIRDQMTDGEYAGQTLFDDGMIVRIQDGQVRTPPKAGALFPDLQPEDIMTEYTPRLFTTADGEDVFITSGRIDDGLYFIDRTDLEEYLDFYNSQISIEKLMTYMSNAYGGEIFLLSGNDPKGDIL